MSNIPVTSYRHILVPLNGSDFSERVLPHALNICKLNGASCHLLRVIPPSLYPPTGLLWGGAVPLYYPALPDKSERRQTQERSAERYLSRIASEFEAEGVRCSSDVVYGELMDAVLSEAEHHRVDLILVASHQRQGLHRLIAPNTSTELSLKAHCPVMVIPEETLQAEPIREYSGQATLAPT